MLLSVAGCRVLGVPLPRALAELPLFFFFYFRGRRELNRAPLFPFEPAVLFSFTGETWVREDAEKGIGKWPLFSRISEQKE